MTDLISPASSTDFERIRPVPAVGTRPPGRGLPRRLTSFDSDVAGVAVIAGSYIVALADAVASSPLIGIAYVSIIVGCLTSMTMIARGNTTGWLLGAAISVAAIVGYIAKHHGSAQGLADTETTSSPVGSRRLAFRRRRSHRRRDDRTARASGRGVARQRSADDIDSSTTPSRFTSRRCLKTTSACFRLARVVRSASRRRLRAPLCVNTNAPRCYLLA